MNQIQISDLPFSGIVHPTGGRVAVVKDEDAETIISNITSNNVEAITLNYALGWCGNDVSFLASLKNVITLNIIGNEIDNLTALQEMESLESLSIKCVSKEDIDFRKLENLKTCYLYWWKGADSIFRNSSLEELYLDEIRMNDFSELGNLKSLRKLAIMNSNIKDLNWISELSFLEELELINCRILTDFSKISNLKGLKKLVIDGCSKLVDLMFIPKLKSLEWLDISNNGQISSIAEIGSCQKIKVLFMDGSTNIQDGNLAPLNRLPRLAILSFTGKKHYSHKLVKKWSWEDIDNPRTLLKIK